MGYVLVIGQGVLMHEWMSGCGRGEGGESLVLGTSTSRPELVAFTEVRRQVKNRFGEIKNSLDMLFESLNSVGSNHFTNCWQLRGRGCKARYWLGFQARGLLEIVSHT